MQNESYHFDSTTNGNSMLHSTLSSKNFHRNDVNKHACSSPVPAPKVQFVRSRVLLAPSNSNRSLLGKLAEENTLVTLKCKLILPLLDHDSSIILDRSASNEHFRGASKTYIPAYISSPPLFFEQSLKETSARVAWCSWTINASKIASRLLLRSHSWSGVLKLNTHRCSAVVNL